MVHDNLSAFADWVLAQGETANRPPSGASVR
jgi:hypothetical protein